MSAKKKPSCERANERPNKMSTVAKLVLFSAALFTVSVVTLVHRQQEKEKEVANSKN